MAAVKKSGLLQLWTCFVQLTWESQWTDFNKTSFSVLYMHEKLRKLLRTVIHSLKIKLRPTKSAFEQF